MKKLTAIALALLVTATTAWGNDNALWQRSTLNQIKKNGVLRVGLEPGFVPFEMLNDKGKVVGFDIDVAKLMAEYMGVKLKVIKLDWNGIMPALLTNQCDIIISGMTITPQRNLWINFADSYMTVGQTVLVRKGLSTKIRTYDQLNNTKYTVATKPGTTALDAIKKFLPEAKVQLYENEATAVDEVLAGRIDGFVYDLPFNAIYYARNRKGLHFLDSPFTHERLGFGIRKGDPDFLNWLNNFLAQIKGDGTYDRLYVRWFKEGEWLKQMKK